MFFLRSITLPVAILLCIVAFNFVAVVFLFFLLRGRNRRSDYELFKAQELLREQERQLEVKTAEVQHLHESVHQSAAELQKKDEESQELQLKLNESFEELLTLAKDNHPNFYTRFREHYPHLHNRLLEIHPGLRISELTLCAYIYLDFTSKEIAEYTFKSIRTIQTRKFHLRKKLAIDSTQDFHSFIKALLQSKVNP